MDEKDNYEKQKKKFFECFKKLFKNTNDFVRFLTKLNDLDVDDLYQMYKQ